MTRATIQQLYLLTLFDELNSELEFRQSHISELILVLLPSHNIKEYDFE
jgi:hypothetical protein